MFKITPKLNANNTAPQLGPLTIMKFNIHATLLITLLMSAITHAGWNEVEDAHKAQNYVLEVQALHPLADQGDAKAQDRLGVMYQKGMGTPLNYEKAIVWFSKASDQGLPSALTNLGDMYAHGRGVPQDYVVAFALISKAASQGYAAAQLRLGHMYDGGAGVDRDYVQAGNWYRKAADQGNPIAQNYLAILYLLGQGVPKDYVEAAKWFRRAGEQGESAGLSNLARQYMLAQGVPLDNVFALALFNVSLSLQPNDYLAKDYRVELLNKLKPDEIQTANSMSTEMLKPGGLVKALAKEPVNLN